MKQNYSVLMSVYKKEKPRFLLRAIESVMSQKIVPDDFVVVCDGELTPDLYNVLDACKHRYHCLNIIHQKENLGLGTSLKNGLSETKNEIVMRMDSDDVCLEQRAEKQLSLIDNYDLVGSWISEFELDEDNNIGIRTVPESYESIKKFSKKRNPFNHPSVMFKKSAILEVGGYEPLLYFEDYYLWLRVLQKNSRVFNIQEVLVNMRSGRTMRSRRGGKVYRKSLNTLRKYMLKEHIINCFEYMFFTFGQIIFSCLPIAIKEKFYRKKLRK